VKMKKKFLFSLSTWIGLAVLAGALLVPLLFWQSEHMMVVLLLMYVFIIYALAWNLLAMSGQGSLGHAAFFGLGGYSSVILANLFLSATGVTIPPYITLIFGGFVAAIVGILIGLTCIRLKEWFLAMVTFGFAVIIHTATPAFSSVTGGWDGLFAAKIFPASVPNYIVYDYYLMLFAAVIVFVSLKLIVRTRLGLAFEAIRENELEARVMGVNVTKYKLFAFAVSAFIAGIAGGLQVHYIGLVTPEVYSADKSFLPIIYCISGGLFSVEGAVIGTVVMTALDEALKTLIPMAREFVVSILTPSFPSFAGYLANLSWDYLKVFVIGLILILVVIFLPKGFISLPGKIRSSFSQIPK